MPSSERGMQLIFHDLYYKSSMTLLIKKKKTLGHNHY